MWKIVSRWNTDWNIPTSEMTTTTPVSRNKKYWACCWTSAESVTAWNVAWPRNASNSATWQEHSQPSKQGVRSPWRLSPWTDLSVCIPHPHCKIMRIQYAGCPQKHRQCLMNTLFHLRVQNHVTCAEAYVDISQVISTRNWSSAHPLGVGEITCVVNGHVSSHLKLIEHS